MNKYVTIEIGDRLEVFATTEDYQPTLKHEECHCWVFQLAESKEQALASHIEKLDQWEDDMDNGRKGKDFY